jgi:hypothetical protein
MSQKFLQSTFHNSKNKKIYVKTKARNKDGLQNRHLEDEPDRGPDGDPGEGAEQLLDLVGIGFAVGVVDLEMQKSSGLPDGLFSNQKSQLG